MKTATLYITTTSGEFDVRLSERTIHKGHEYFIDIDTLVKLTVGDIRNDFRGSDIEIIDVVRVDGVEMGGAL